MAISPIVVAWMSNLKSRGVLRGGAMLEMGPSDLILYTPASIEFYIRRHVPAERVGAVMDKIFDSQGHFRSEGIAPLYGVFGYEKYRSIDLGDPRADWQCDLNYPVDIPERFDAITNFGTAEHVFNISEVFRSMHALLRKGGVQLHVMPVAGAVNHGFYNIHPTVYLDVAKANDYVVEDIRYIDEIDRRTSEHTARFQDDVDFEALPIGRAQLELPLTLEAEVDKTHTAIQQRTPGVVAKDYAFVALRKVREQPFRIPIQSLYAPRLHRRGGSIRLPSGAIAPAYPRRMTLPRLLIAGCLALSALCAWLF
jgi:SAM-dependent methyltransferase